MTNSTTQASSRTEATNTLPRLVVPYHDAFRADAGHQRSYRASVLDLTETWWHEHSEWLASRGYQLRPRYRKGWQPSWKASGVKQSALNRVKCEDAQVLDHAYILDAVRMSDGQQVCLKRIDCIEHPKEINIGRYLTHKKWSRDPMNHCVPILDVLSPPQDTNWVILVMPLLLPFDAVRWETIGEAAEFFRQVFDGLKFMHDRGVAHRDCNVLNIMMESSRICPGGFHPLARHMNKEFTGKAKYGTRTEARPRYYFIDFGISEQYDISNGPVRTRYVGSGDKTVPEFQGSRKALWYDPFAADVYMLGNIIRTSFTQGDGIFVSKKAGFGFIEGLVSQMTNPNPAKRPTMSDVVQQYSKILEGLTPSQLKARVKTSEDGVFRNISYWVKRVHFLVAKLNPLPTPPTPTTPTRDPRRTQTLPVLKRVGHGQSRSATLPSPVTPTTGSNWFA